MEDVIPKQVSPKIFITENVAQPFQSDTTLPDLASNLMDDTKTQQRIRSLFDQVTDAAASLDRRVAEALQHQEVEFLRAFRSHMYAVTTELTSLRSRADETAAQSARDDVLRTTAAARSHYRDEALRLDSEVSKLRVELATQRERADAAEEEAIWLRTELLKRARVSGERTASRDPAAR